MPAFATASAVASLAKPISTVAVFGFGDSDDDGAAQHVHDAAGGGRRRRRGDAQQGLGGGHLHAAVGVVDRPHQRRLAVAGRLQRPRLGQVAQRPHRPQHDRQAVVVQGLFQHLVHEVGVDRGQQLAHVGRQRLVRAAGPSAAFSSTSDSNTCCARA